MYVIEQISLNLKVYKTVISVGKELPSAMDIHSTKYNKV